MNILYGMQADYLIKHEFRVNSKEFELKSLLTEKEYDYYIHCDVHHNDMLWKAANNDPAKMAEFVKDWYSEIGEE